MRRALCLTVAFLLPCGLAAPAFAQTAPQVIISHEMTNQDLNQDELQAFDQVATANLKMSRRLAANPHLANSGSFLRRWPDLNNFFAKYPGSKERFLEDPGNYLADVNMHSGQKMSAPASAANSGTGSAETPSTTAGASAPPPASAAPQSPPPEPPKLPASPSSPPPSMH
jgi:hypothetical protein